MASTITIDLRHVARGLNIPQRQVQAVVELLDEGNTIPFITRYRKDQTGGLDEDQIRQIQSRLAKQRQLAERKQTILRSIEAQGKLTDELSQQILAVSSTKRLEDLYLPYRPKKQTLATQARERGLEPLAREILEAAPACADLDARARDFVNPDRQVPTAADALLGAGYILAEHFSEQPELRQQLREILQRTGKFYSTRAGGEAKEPAETPPKLPTAQHGSEAPKDSDAPKAPGSEEPAAEDAAPNDAVSGDAKSKDDTAASPPEPPVIKIEEAPPTASADEVATATDPPAAEAPVAEAPIAETLADALPPSPPPQPAPVEVAEMPASAVETSDQPSSPAETPSQAEAMGDAEATGDRTDKPAAVPADATADAPQETNPPATAPDGESAESSQSTAEQASSGAAESTPPAKAPPKRRKRESKQPKLSKKEQKKKQAEERLIRAFHDYFDYREEIKKIPPHRVLAINRGERAKVLRVRLESDQDAMQRAVDEAMVPLGHAHAEYLRGCARDALGRLILPSLEREIRRELTDRAEQHAVEVFAKNLRNLLLQPPIHDRRVLAVDPGFRSGCKLVALDQFGNVLEHGVIFLVGAPARREEAKRKVMELVARYDLSVAVIGNGTACRQTEEFFAELIANELKEQGLRYVIVNEAGASVYSVSRLGREEFPEYDATVRGAISIGRRLQDPLSELVKIDAASIGVGLYQHDVKAKHLRSSLDEVVESCVNYVGVDVNSASPALLRYVSGLNQLTARRVYEHRREHGPFRNREQLREVPGLGEATFVQAAGFLKITGGDNRLDATWIHPESYEAADRVLSKLGCAPSDLADKGAIADLAKRAGEIDVEATAGELGVGALTLKDILSDLTRPGRDPREDLPAPMFKQGVMKLEDLSPGMDLAGTVLNVVDFGAFIDIGMHDSGLVHVSQLADRFVRDPHDVVAVGDIVRVWVISVDKDRRRVSLTMIRPGSKQPRPARESTDKQEPTDTQGQGQGGRGKRPERSGDRPPRDRGKGRPKARGDRQDSKSGRRPRTQGPPSRGGPPQHGYQAKPKPKPFVPISEAMKSGKAPMRTFSDLAQFLQLQEEAAPEKSPAEEPAKPAAQADPPRAPAQEETLPVKETPPVDDTAPAHEETPPVDEATPTGEAAETKQPSQETPENPTDEPQ